MILKFFIKTKFEFYRKVGGDRVVYNEDGVKHEGEIIEFLYDGLAVTIKLDDGSHFTCGTRWVQKISK